MDKQILIFCRPPFGQFNRTDIGSDVVVLSGYFWGIDRLNAAPRISHINIDRISVSIHFPDTGNRHIDPRAVIEVVRIKIRGTQVGILYPIELPQSIQRDEIGRFFPDIFPGSRLIFIGEIGGVHRSTVNGIDFGVQPLRKGLSRTHCCHQRCRDTQKKTFLHI